MDERYYDREFENFVKRNADQYRMYPSDKVWKNIHHNLHTRRKWYAIGITLLLLSIGAVTGVMLSTTSTSKSISAISNKRSEATSVHSDSKSLPLVAINQEKKTANKKPLINTPETLQQSLFSISTTDNSNNDEQNNIASLSYNPIAPIQPSDLIAKVAQPEHLFNTALTFNKPASPAKNKTLFVSNSDIQNNKTETAFPSNIDEVKPAAKEIAEIKLLENKQHDIFPTIESVVLNYKHDRRAKKLSWEIFVTPNITYRRLSENKDFIAAAQSVNNNLNYTAFTNINSLVTHRPDVGLQLGTTASYPILKNVNLVAGVQFNISKYDILANYSTPEVTTIALNSGAGANSVSTTSNYRNFNFLGNNSSWLRNFYFSASIPIGAEIKIASKGNTQIGVRGTVQPTYIIGDRAYLISTDYKNYAEFPELIRRVNINSGLELFATFPTGKVKWKIGPQARYQSRSSFKSQYPIKEHLFDFGIKVGIMLH